MRSAACPDAAAAEQLTPHQRHDPRETCAMPTTAAGAPAANPYVTACHQVSQMSQTNLLLQLCCSSRKA